MIKKELLKELIVSFQATLPVEFKQYERYNVVY